MEKKYFDLIVKDLSGEISPEEKDVLQNWLPGNEGKYQDLRNLWDKTFVKEEFEIDEDKAWRNLTVRIARSEQPPFAFLRNKLLQIAAAAVFLLIASLFVLRETDKGVRLDKIVSNGNIEIFYLPDSSQVWLNKNSTLTIEEDFAGKERRVKLVGEAFFRVKRDPLHPFIIVAGSSVTKVLGTEFEIKAYPDSSSVEINVQSGRVEFSSLENKSSSILLIKDEKGMLDKSSGSVKKIETIIPEEAWLPNTIAETSVQSEDKHLKEITSPKLYLRNNFKWRDNIIKQVIIEGEVANQAVFTSYKNIRLKATYYTQEKNKMGVEYYMIPKNLEPGNQFKYKFRLGNWFRQASKVELEVEDAHAIE